MDARLESLGARGLGRRRRALEDWRGRRGRLAALRLDVAQVKVPLEHPQARIEALKLALKCGDAVARPLGSQLADQPAEAGADDDADGPEAVVDVKRDQATDERSSNPHRSSSPSSASSTSSS